MPVEVIRGLLAPGTPTSNDPVIVKLPDMIALPVNGNVAICGAKDADKAWVAYDAVPCNEPVIDGAISEPVTVSPFAVSYTHLTLPTKRIV